MSQTRPTDRSVDEENNRQDEGESKSREGTSREGVNNTVDNKATEQGGFSTSETSTTSDNKFSINETADTTESAKFDENDRAELEEKLGKDLADNVHFVDEDTEVPHADVRRFKRVGVEGWFNPRTNKIYLVVESIKANEVLTRQERLAWVATHELAHAGVKTQFSTLLNNVLTNARSHFLVKGIADKIKKDRADRGLPISDMVATEEALVELYAAVKTGKWEELESRYGIKIHESWRNGEKSVQPLLERVATILKRLMSRVIGRPITDEEVFTILSGIEKGIDTYAKSGRDTDSNGEVKYRLNDRQKEQRGIYNVSFNEKKSTQIKKDLDDVNEALKYEKGRADRVRNNGRVKNGFGSLHIDKHLDPNMEGYVTKQELLHMGDIIRNANPENSRGKRLYEKQVEGVRFRVVIGRSPSGERVISFFSNRSPERRGGSGAGSKSLHNLFNLPPQDNYRGQIEADQDEKFSVAENTDYKRDLMVTHNISADGIVHADRMGGLPLASVAVTKQENPLKGFGEVTLIGDRNYIDHKGANAWVLTGFARKDQTVEQSRSATTSALRTQVPIRSRDKVGAFENSSIE